MTIIEVADTIIALTSLAGLIITLIKLHQQREEEMRKFIREIAQQEIIRFTESNEFNKAVSSVIDNTSLSKKVNEIDKKITQLITILCYENEKLLQTGLCDGVRHTDLR